MRILILTILFAATFYFFNQGDEDTLAEVKIDSLKVKMGAPERQIEETKSQAPKDRPAKVAPKPSQGLGIEHVDEDSAHIEEFSSNDFEADWNAELKEMLSRLEPAESEQIFKDYISQMESYQSELDSLLNEREQKTTDREAIEIDQYIDQLDQHHQKRLIEILGAHYEAVRDHYADFVEASQNEY